MKTKAKFVSFGDLSFNVIDPQLWNSLPIHIKCSGTCEDSSSTVLQT